jgi:hypothetical protein
MELADLTNRVRRADGVNVKSLLVDRVHREVASALERRVKAKLRAAVADAMSTPDALTAAATDAVVRTARHERLPILHSIRRTTSWSTIIRDLITGSTFKADAAGQHHLDWLGAYEYFREVCHLETETRLLRGLWLFAKNASWIRPHEHACWLAERPDILCGDARGRLHNSRGPALRYRDGWSLYAWKGVEVPAWIIERPDKITLQSIDDVLDVQVRRCMIEIMTPEHFVSEGGADRIADDNTGTLWRKTWWMQDAWAVVEVINGTPGPDGNRRHYFLQVPPHMRTPREAVAWTYGMSEDDYARLTRRT